MSDFPDFGGVRMRPISLAILLIPSFHFNLVFYFNLQLDLLELEMKERHNYSDHKQEELKEEVQALESELRSQEHELDKTVKEKIALQEKVIS